jgi:hypothetical protein
MTESSLSVPEFMAAIRPELERQVDEMILAQPEHEQKLLRKYRSVLIRQAMLATEAANWRRRAELAEEQLQRLQPRLVMCEEVSDG